MTNKIVLRSVDEFMTDYVPTYQPLYPLLMGKSQAYEGVTGVLNFKRLEAVGDLRAKRYTPKDTEMEQIAATEKSKTYKKYFFANQFVQSQLQDSQQNEDVIKQVLDEHQKQMDELISFGDGTSPSTVKNNGLFYSEDVNYKLESSVEIDTDADPLIDLHSKIMANVELADQVAGRKVIIFYGADVIARVDSLFAASSKAFKASLMESLGANYSIAKMPSAITPSSVNGWIIVNLDQVKTHYCALPSLKDQGINSEKMYSWHNFLMGSAMVEVLSLNGIIKQPCTFEA